MLPNSLLSKRIALRFWSFVSGFSSCVVLVLLLRFIGIFGLIKPEILLSKVEQHLLRSQHDKTKSVRIIPAGIIMQGSAISRTNTALVEVSLCNQSASAITVRRPIPGLTLVLDSVDIVTGDTLPPLGETAQVAYVSGNEEIVIPKWAVTQPEAIEIESLFGKSPKDGLYLCRLTYFSRTNISVGSEYPSVSPLVSNLFLLSIADGRIADTSFR